MNDKRDNTRFIAVTVIAGLVVTISLGFVLLYLTSVKDSERDKYFADHCQFVSRSEDKSFEPTVTTYSCNKN